MQVLHDTFFFIIKWACGQYVCLNELHGRNTIKNAFELYKDISEIAMFNV